MVSFLHESDSLEIFPLPLPAKRHYRVPGEGNIAIRPCLADFAHRANDGSMAQFLSGVLPARYRRVQTRLRDRQPHFRRAALWRRKELPDLDRKIFLAGPVYGAWGQSHGNLGSRRRFRNRLQSLLCSSPGKLRGPVHHHLRRVRVAVAEHTGIGVLPNRPVVGRKWVLPTQIVPVVHVFFQRDHLCIADAAHLLKLGE